MNYTCYLNCILRILLVELCHDLHDIIIKEKLFKYNNINNISYSPIKFKNILIKHFPNYITGKHDAIEFLKTIFRRD